MAWFKVTSDKLSRRLDNPNDKNTFEEYEYFKKGDVLELDPKKDDREIKRRLKNGSITVASDEEAAAAAEAKEQQEEQEIDEAQKRIEEQREYLANLDRDRLGAPGERQFDPELAEARAKREEERQKEQAKAEADSKAASESGQPSSTGAKKASPASSSGQQGKSTQSQ